MEGGTPHTATPRCELLAQFNETSLQPLHIRIHIYSTVQYSTCGWQYTLSKLQHKMCSFYCFEVQTKLFADNTSWQKKTGNKTSAFHAHLTPDLRGKMLLCSCFEPIATALANLVVLKKWLKPPVGVYDIGIINKMNRHICTTYGS